MERTSLFGSEETALYLAVAEVEKSFLGSGPQNERQVV